MNYPDGVKPSDFDEQAYITVCKGCGFKVTEDDIYLDDNDTSRSACCDARVIEITEREYNDNQ